MSALSADQRREAVTLYDRFTHDGMDRRAMMRAMTRIAGSLAAAELLVEALAADPAAASITKPDDARLVITRGPLGFSSPLSGYVAVRKRAKKSPILLVIHENRGLNAHIEDVTRRLALEGFFAVAPDMLSLAGGTPANEDAARQAIGKLDLGAAVAAAAQLAVAMKAGLSHGNGHVGVIGFCWGGAFVNRLALAMGATLDAGVSYYGPAPDPSEAGRIRTPLLMHYAGLDDRVAKTGDPWVAALKAAGRDVTAYSYPGVNHAFNNDTSAERYDAKAAALAWKRSIDFLRRHLR